jgi:hypothetical protein
MRIILLGFFTLMGVNLFVTVMNSDMANKMEERNEVLERLMSPPSTEIR